MGEAVEPQWVEPASNELPKARLSPETDEAVARVRDAYVMNDIDTILAVVREAEERLAVAEEVNDKFRAMVDAAEERVIELEGHMDETSELRKALREAEERAEKADQLSGELADALAAKKFDHEEMAEVAESRRHRITQLEAENERLRAALELLRPYHDSLGLLLGKRDWHRFTQALGEEVTESGTNTRGSGRQHDRRQRA